MMPFKNGLQINIFKQKQIVVDGFFLELVASIKILIFLDAVRL